jgi:hypothetical protein
MEHIVFEVGLALTLVAGAALLSARLRFSVVPFLILAGMVVGPPMPKLGIVDLRFIQSAPLIEFMGRLGILFLLFYLGLEFSLSRLIKAGRLIVVGGTIYIALNFGLGLGNDDDIGGFAALDTFHGRAGRGERDRERVSGRALERVNVSSWHPPVRWPTFGPTDPSTADGGRRPHRGVSKNPATAAPVSFTAW